MCLGGEHVTFPHVHDVHQVHSGDPEVFVRPLLPHLKRHVNYVFEKSSPCGFRSLAGENAGSAGLEFAGSSSASDDQALHLRVGIPRATAALGMTNLKQHG